MAVSGLVIHLDSNNEDEMMNNSLIEANRMFSDSDHQAFPVCTQVTLCHGICDSRCISCPVGQVYYGDASADVKEEFSTGSRLFMPFEIFTRVADEVALHPHAWLRMHARGEPLLHPRFVDMVRYAKQAGVRLVQTFTDAIRLDEAMALNILEAGLDVLECSVHGHSQTYEPLMRNGRYQQVKANVIGFRRLRDRLSAKKGYKIVIFGHTHKAKIDKDSLFVADRIYANTGCWSQKKAHCVIVEADTDNKATVNLCRVKNSGRAVPVEKETI